MTRVFRPEERERVRERLLELARADDRITGAALTGSAASGEEDRWSDVDVFLGVSETTDIGSVMDDWSGLLSQELDVVHYWDLPAGPAIYRVFLLSSCLQVDVAFTPESDFGARGPSFRVVFGDAVERPHIEPPSVNDLVGFGWLYVVHARGSIERGKAWQSELMISSVREQTLQLACLRFGERGDYRRGVHRLPREVTAPLEHTLTRSLDPAELRRVLTVAAEAFLREVREARPELAARLEAPLRELVAT
jgi:predicted nucleotidyltransferase